MSRFNQIKKPQVPNTVNLAGGAAYTESPQLQLVSVLLTSFLTDRFYNKASDQLNDLRNSFVNLKDKKFAAKAAIFARNEFGMRTITHALAAEIAHSVKGEQWTKDFFKQVIFRPDDMLEILSYYQAVYGTGNKLRPIPNSLKKAIRTKLEATKATGGFDEYQLAKYRKVGNEISLVDVVNLVHPNTKLNPAIHKLVKDELRVTGKTWEAQLSEAGKAEDVEEAKTAAWGSLLKEHKLGYMALVKNLRNISETKDAAVIDLAAKELVNEDKIKHSKVFPFRLYIAYNELKKARANQKLIDALHDALDISLSNIPAFPGKTLIAMDVSGSMDSPLKGDSSITIMEAGSIFAGALFKTLDADVIRFKDTAEYFTSTKRMSVLELAQKLTNCSFGGTNFSSIFSTADKKYDRIFILSDMQSWIGETQRSFAAYKGRTLANPYLYCIDLAGYGTLQFPETKVASLAGFSDKMFDIISIHEQDKNVLIKKIEAITL